MQKGTKVARVSTPSRPVRDSARCRRACWNLISLAALVKLAFRDALLAVDHFGRNRLSGPLAWRVAGSERRAAR